MVSMQIPHMREETSNPGLIVRTMSGKKVLELPAHEGNGFDLAELKRKVFESTGVLPHLQVLRDAATCASVGNDQQPNPEAPQGCGRPQLPMEWSLVVLHSEPELGQLPCITSIRVPTDGSVEVSFNTGKLRTELLEGMLASHSVRAFPTFYGEPNFQQAQPTATEQGESPLTLRGLLSHTEYTVYVCMAMTDCNGAVVESLQSSKVGCMPAQPSTIYCQHLVAVIGWLAELGSISLALCLLAEQDSGAESDQKSVLSTGILASLLAPTAGLNLWGFWGLMRRGKFTTDYEAFGSCCSYFLVLCMRASCLQLPGLTLVCLIWLVHCEWQFAAFYIALFWLPSLLVSFSCMIMRGPLAIIGCRRACHNQYHEAFHHANEACLFFEAVLGDFPRLCLTMMEVLHHERSAICIALFSLSELGMVLLITPPRVAHVLQEWNFVRRGSYKGFEPLIIIGAFVLGFGLLMIGAMHFLTTRDMVRC